MDRLHGVVGIPKANVCHLLRMEPRDVRMAIYIRAKTIPPASWKRYLHADVHVP